MLTPKTALMDPLLALRPTILSLQPPHSVVSMSITGEYQYPLLQATKASCVPFKPSIPTATRANKREQEQARAVNRAVEQSLNGIESYK